MNLVKYKNPARSAQPPLACALNGGIALTVLPCLALVWNPAYTHYIFVERR
jgi:hypothetical protein